MATPTSQNFRGRFTDIQRDHCISYLNAWVQALETIVGELSRAPTNPNGESSSASIQQNQGFQLDTGSRESIQEFL